MIDKIINEWTYQLDAGYPTKESDYEILRSVLQETNMLSEQEINRTIYQAKGLNEQDESFLETMTNKLLDANVKQPVIDDVIQTYNTLSEQEKIAFKENFRTHSIESYVNGEGYKPFVKFWPIKGGDQGSGEVPITLGVANTMSGGNQDKDIKLGKEKWEVKELSKNADFDPAGDGDANKFPFTFEVRDFYKNIIEPYVDLGDVFNTLSTMVDTESHVALKRMIQIINDRFAQPVQNPMTINIFREVPYGRYWENWYRGFQELNKIFYETKLDTDVRDTRITTNQAGKKQSYWVSDDEAEKFAIASSTNKPITINIGDTITDENRDVVIWFKRLERSIFIKDPSYLPQQLVAIKNEFFSGLTGVIWYYKSDTTPHIGTANDFVNHNVTKGHYRMKLAKSADLDKYTFIAAQS